MSTSAPASGETTLRRSFGGVLGCCAASVPLGVGYSLHGFYTSGETWSAAYVVMGTLVVVVFSLLIASMVSVAVGVPTYMLAVRTGPWRGLVLILAAVTSAVFVSEVWGGGLVIFEDLERTALFAFFGLYSGLAFWVGVDVWRPIE